MTQATHAVVAITDPDTGAVLLTKRAATLRLHAGEYCFPGGRIESGELPLDTALRELEEETGLRAGAIAIGASGTASLFRQVTTYTTGKTFAVIYAAARDAGSLLASLTLNPDEVESAKWFDPATCRVVDEDSGRGVVRVVDDADDTYIEGATADVVAALFTLWEGRD